MQFAPSLVVRTIPPFQGIFGAYNPPAARLRLPRFCVMIYGLVEMPGLNIEQQI